ncbi:MAG: hypothetical protein FWD13_06210 [Treponema sp.]|nr:hypothetical protein [Treponema sp.]
MEAYYRILNRLSPTSRLSLTSEKLTASVDLDMIIDARFRFNEDVSWYPQQSKINPFLAFTIQAFVVDSLQLYFEPTFSVKHGVRGNYGYGIFDTNIPLNSYHFDAAYWPMKAFASVGGSWWNFYIGRDHLSWGTAHSGGLVYSYDTHFYDFAYLSFFTPHFKYSVIVNHLPLWLGNSLFNEPPIWDTWDNNRYTMQRYFYLHRIDISIKNKFSLSLMEGVMVGNSPLELRYLNPITVFHSMYSWRDYPPWEPGKDITEASMVGSILSLEVNWNILTSLAVYGQFMMNQFALPHELAIHDQGPNSFGILAGAHYSHSFNTWGSLFHLEFVYTDPYAYILSSPFSSFLYMVEIPGNYSAYLLGHSRDTILLTAGAKFFNKDNTLSFSGNLSWITSGVHNKDRLTYDYEETPEAFNKRTPSGIAENKFILSLGANWQPYCWLKLGANLTGIISINNNHISGNNTAGGQVSLSASLHY